MIETIKIGDKEVNMKVTANTPRKYREMFNKDLIVELQGFMKHINPKGELTEGFDFGVVERLGYTMALQADSNIGSIDDWLDGFEGIDDMYIAMGEIIGLWQKSKTSIAVPKKKTVGQ